MSGRQKGASKKSDCPKNHHCGKFLLYELHCGSILRYRTILFSIYVVTLEFERNIYVLSTFSIIALPFVVAYSNAISKYWVKLKSFQKCRVAFISAKPKSVTTLLNNGQFFLCYMQKALNFDSQIPMDVASCWQLYISRMGHTLLLNVDTITPA